VFAAGPATASGVLVVPVLEVKKTPAKATAAAGENDSYKIHIENTGEGTAHEVVVVDTIPAGMTYKRKSRDLSRRRLHRGLRQSRRRDFGTSPPLRAQRRRRNQRARRHRTDAPVETELTNKVAVHSMDAPTEKLASGIITLTNSADVAVTKTILTKGNIVPGHELTYEVSATNQRPVCRARSDARRQTAQRTHVRERERRVRAERRHRHLQRRHAHRRAEGHLPDRCRRRRERPPRRSATPCSAKARRPTPNRKTTKPPPIHGLEPRGRTEPRQEHAHARNQRTARKAVFKLIATNEGPSDAAETEIGGHAARGPHLR